MYNDAGLIKYQIKNVLKNAINKNYEYKGKYRLCSQTKMHFSSSGRFVAEDFLYLQSNVLVMHSETIERN